MSYDLHSIYNVVMDWEHQWKKGMHSRHETETCGSAGEAIRSIQAFPAWFLQKAGGLENKKALTVMVNVHLTAITDLLNRLERFPEKGSGIIDSNGKPDSSMAQMKSALLTSFYWLKRIFASHVAADQPLPQRLAREAEEMLTAELPHIKEKLQAAGMEAHWITGIIGSLSSVIKGNSLTCHQLQYLRSLYTAIQTPALAVSGNRQIVKWLIEQNLNIPGIVSYAIEQYRLQESDILSLDSREEEAGQWLRMPEDAQESGPGFHPEHPSCKQAFSAAFKGGRQYLKSKRSGLAAIYGSNTAPGVSVKSASPLTVTLSVSQLAVFCRLFIDCGIIQQGNQTELLKTVAGALQTTRTASISADSLRAKYYSPDRATLSVVKEHLFKMLSLVKEM